MTDKRKQEIREAALTTARLKSPGGCKAAIPLLLTLIVELTEDNAPAKEESQSELWREFEFDLFGPDNSIGYQTKNHLKSKWTLSPAPRFE